VTGPPLVRCVNVAQTYGTGPSAVVAVHGATCTVSVGDGIALVGPSGSGKSTLLHLMAGLDTPTAGQISWPAIGGPAEIRPGPVGIVFQGPSLLPALDVVENVALPLLLEGADPHRATSRARHALQQLGLEELAPKLPEELSGGQAQRVAIARVLAATPRLILADEPTGQLDHATATGVVDLLIHAAATSRAALVISTHDPAIAERLPQRWDMSDGRLVVGPDTVPVADGTPCSA
jgi:putative ABC transport system ATP-binding protein